MQSNRKDAATILRVRVGAVGIPRGCHAIMGCVDSGRKVDEKNRSLTHGVEIKRCSLISKFDTKGVATTRKNACRTLTER